VDGAQFACAGAETDMAQLQSHIGLYGLTLQALPIDLGFASEEAKDIARNERTVRLDTLLASPEPSGKTAAP
jgi:hypothetical protein